MKSLPAVFNERITVSGKASSQVSKRLAKFETDESGNIGMIFGGTLMAMATVVGGAVDYGRYVNARTQTQSALDAASLAGGRVLQLGGTAAKAVDVANQVYAAQKSRFSSRDTVSFQPPTNGGTSIAPAGGVDVATPFLSIVGISTLKAVPDAATVSGSCVGPSCGTGGNAGTNIEISLMLDTTGSMQGDKLAALKVAAKDLIDIVVWDDQSKYSSRVAIAPFSEAVNVSSKYFTAVTNEPLTSQVITGYGSYSYPSSCYKNGQLKSSCDHNSKYGVNPTYGPGPLKSTCVIERVGSNEFTDLSPAGVGVAPSNISTIPWNGQSGTCAEASSIQPLTKDKAVLKGVIDGLVAANYTAGALGTAWAWYLLSPGWSNVFTGTAAPASYSELTEMTADNQPKLRKIAILMTDGAYNTFQQTQGLSESVVSAKAVSLCTAMKAKGIQVYTIGFQVGTSGTAVNTLTDCASSHVIDTGASIKNFYNTDTATSLQAAFRDIALQISKLRLTR
jgi:Flp pilus assembly protein TadG